MIWINVVKILVVLMVVAATVVILGIVALHVVMMDVVENKKIVVTKISSHLQLNYKFKNFNILKFFFN